MFLKIIKILTSYQFAILVTLITIYSWPFLTHTYLPTHDTLNNFDLFYFFYNQFYSTGQIAQWMPHYGFGIPAGYWQIFAISPFGYLCMLFGYIFKIPNALFLFNLSFYFEHLVFLYGMYVLSCQLFTLNSTRFFVCLGATSIHSIIGQVCFGLQLFYIFPLIAFCIVRFFATKNPLFFWLSGICAIVGAIGNTLYFPFIWAFATSILLIGLGSNNLKTFKTLLSPKINNILPCALFLLIGLCIFLTIAPILQFAQMPFRVGGKTSNSIGMFLTYGDTFNIKKLVTWFVSGNNWNVYLGLIPLIFFIYALLKERSRIFFVFLSSTCGVLCLTFGGFLALCIYFFPGMSQYRHIGMSYDLLKPLMLICAGFGWENFFLNPQRKKLRLFFAIPLIILFFSDSLGISWDWISFISGHKDQLAEFFTTYHFSSGIMRILFYVIGLSTLLVLYRIKTKNIGLWATVILLSIQALDIAAFEDTIHKNSQSYRIEDNSRYKYTFNTSPLPYQHQRLQTPSPSRARDAWDLKRGDTPGSILYTTAFSFTQYEPCESDARQDFVPNKITAILPIKKMFNPKNGYTIFGCSAPKLRLVSNALYTPHLGEMLTTLTNIDATNTVLFQDITSSNLPRNLINAEPPLDQNIEINAFNSDTLQTTVTNSATDDSWLVYADSFHPGWKATIDGKTTSVLAAYGAFKSVRIPAGKHIIALKFKNGIHSLCSYFVAIFGLLAGVFLLGLMCRALLTINIIPNH